MAAVFAPRRNLARACTVHCVRLPIHTLRSIFSLGLPLLDRRSGPASVENASMRDNCPVLTYFRIQHSGFPRRCSIQ